MLVIRTEQMRVLGQNVLARLIEAAVQHVRDSVPDVFDQMGADRVRESVLLAKSKAADYGLETWSDVIAYLNVMYIIGFHFDEDPRYGWAKQTLEIAELSTQEKMDSLLRLAMKESEAAHASS